MSSTRQQRFSWAELGGVPTGSGIYAWYYRPELTERDIKDAIRTIESEKAAGREDEAGKAVQKFLNERLFKYFEEDSYKVHVHGSLKPRYEGLLDHASIVPNTLVERVVGNPNRLWQVKSVLEAGIPEFSSPLYIGMSKNLAQRIHQHKRLIERYRSVGYLEPNVASSGKSARDTGFAISVCNKGMAPSRLVVYCHIIRADSNEYLDIEYLLNRLHFPLMGRN